jgi:hypothetical protein
VVEVATGAAGAESVGVSCTSPALALGGGTSTTDDTPGQGLLETAPLEQYSTTNTAEDGETPTGWFADWDQISSDETVTVYAICTSA